jgi:hypothetical protein
MFSSCSNGYTLFFLTKTKVKVNQKNNTNDTFIQREINLNVDEETQNTNFWGCRITIKDAKFVGYL